MNPHLTSVHSYRTTTGRLAYRWTCSCGASLGVHRTAHLAERGGEQHAARAPHTPTIRLVDEHY